MGNLLQFSFKTQVSDLLPLMKTIDVPSAKADPHMERRPPCPQTMCCQDCGLKVSRLTLKSWRWVCSYCELSQEQKQIYEFAQTIASLMNNGVSQRTIEKALQKLQPQPHSV
jgi:hypothetical protein